MPILVSGVQYSGMWTLDQATNAVAAGTWPVVPPDPTALGALWAWGSGANGGLAQITNIVNKSSPVQIGAATDWLNVTAGRYNGFGVDSSNKLWVWGNDAYGMMGLTTRYVNKSSPTQVGALTNWLRTNTLVFWINAIKTNGTMWAWGRNNNSCLGVNISGGVQDTFSSPTQVGSATDWLNSSAGAYHGLATKTTGTLWAWGSNQYGQLGQSLSGASLSEVSSPVQIGSDTNWSKVVCSQGASLAIKTNGTLWSWGNNTSGELGQNSTIPRSSPVQVGALTTWADIKANYFSVFALKTDGTLWAWGYGANGRLGLGDTNYRSSPTQIGTSSWVAVAAGYQNGGAVKYDGTLWMWGNGLKAGQNGLNNTSDYSSPKQVGTSTRWLNISGGIYNFLAKKAP